MNSFVLPLLMAGQQAGEGAQGGPTSFLTSMLPFAAIIAIFYFLIIRPQSRKKKETEKMLSSLRKGDKVVTIGGVHGIIQSVKETTVIVRVDENVKMEFNRSAISSIHAGSREEKNEEKEESSETENTQK